MAVAGKRLRIKSGHALAPDVRAAEVAVQRAVEVARVLEIDRLVEAELMADRGESLRVGLGAGHRDRRIGRDHEGDRESDDRGAEQNRRTKDDSPDDVGDHLAQRDSRLCHREQPRGEVRARA